MAGLITRLTTGDLFVWQNGTDVARPGTSTEQDSEIAPGALEDTLECLTFVAVILSLQFSS